MNLIKMVSRHLNAMHLWGEPELLQIASDQIDNTTRLSLRQTYLAFALVRDKSTSTKRRRAAESPDQRETTGATKRIPLRIPEMKESNRANAR